MIPESLPTRSARAGSGGISDIPIGPEFIALGRCAETDPELFYPEQGGSSRQAVAVCRGCDVRAECLAWALETNEQYGIFGGLTARQRQLRRRAS